MNTEYYIARRYLLSRNRKFFSLSTTIAIGGVFVGVAALLIALSMMNGFQNELKRRILAGTPHIIVRRYFNEPLSKYREIEKRLEKFSFIQGTAPFLIQKSIIKNRERMDGVIIKGVVSAQERRITAVAEKIQDGHFELEDGCVLGIELARNLQAQVGDTLIIALPFGQQPGFLPRAKKVILKGIFNFGYYDYDATIVYMDLKDVQSLFRMKGQVSGIEIKVRDIYQVVQYSKLIEKELGYPYRTQNWMETNHAIFGALKMEKIITFIVLTLIIVVAGFNIVGTLVNMVKKKTKEIGILRSFGFTSSRIMKIFIYHGTLIGIMGTILGLLFAFLACTALDNYQISLPGDIYFIETLPVEMSVGDFIITAFAAIVITFLATIYPARRATRLTTVDALRNE